MCERRMEVPRVERVGSVISHSDPKQRLFGTHWGKPPNVRAEPSSTAVTANVLNQPVARLERAAPGTTTRPEAAPGPGADDRARIPARPHRVPGMSSKSPFMMFGW
ncbi:hypothetical protein GCM10010503_34930 [Streptomyces lucensis JCM 4490]|uniref:Uncharacterized protein n=1 Tax=Streptomyces lucensis JCM 4490 TaxID=1306176 RepID=A0A918J7B6_9ACTN|nr:hypothetical protein GCM10010503_34930 [Streptomyces lucensis JCM 4490]